LEALQEKENIRRETQLRQATRKLSKNILSRPEMAGFDVKEPVVPGLTVIEWKDYVKVQDLERLLKLTPKTQKIAVSVEEGTVILKDLETLAKQNPSRLYVIQGSVQKTVALAAIRSGLTRAETIQMALADNVLKTRAEKLREYVAIALNTAVKLAPGNIVVIGSEQVRVRANRRVLITLNDLISAWQAEKKAAKAAASSA
jgi:hypothetical protein